MTIGEQTVSGPRGGLPHGGQLVDRRLDAEEASALASRPAALAVRPRRPTCALATGAYSPLTGFMGPRSTSRSPSRCVCPTAPSGRSRCAWASPAGSGSTTAAWPCGAKGELLGVLEVTEVFERDRAAEAELVYGTSDPEHPGVARVLGAPSQAVAGPVQAVVAPLAGPVGERALTPAETRPRSPPRGWSTVVGFQTRNPVHRAHEYLMKCALEMVDGLLLQAGRPTKEGDVPAEVRMRAYEAVLGYFPPERVLLSALVAPMRYAGPPRGRAACPGPQELRLHPFHRRPRPRRGGQLLRHLRGPGADRLAARRGPGHHPLRFDNAFYCRRCLAMATGRTCPHPDSDHVALSGTQVRTMLAAGRPPPPEFSRAEVAELLIEAYRLTLHRRRHPSHDQRHRLRALAHRPVRCGQVDRGRQARSTGRARPGRAVRRRRGPDQPLPGPRLQPRGP